MPSYNNKKVDALTSPSFPPVQPSWQRVLLWYWTPALIWAAAIAMFSGKAFGYSHTQTMLMRVFAVLHIHMSAAQFGFLHGVIRKAAHFNAYAILSALFFRAFRGTYPTVRRWQILWASLALAVSLFAASADEFHQTLTPGRTGTWKDVVLDMVGALFAQTIIVIATAGNRNRRNGRPSSGGRLSEDRELLESLRLSPNQPRFEDSSGD